MKQSDHQWNFLQDMAELIIFASGMGYKLTGGELMRTKYQQEQYVRQGLSWTMNSRHIAKQAIDLNLFIHGKYTTNKADYEELGSYWESLHENNRWGGRFNDAGHFERLDRPREG